MMYAYKNNTKSVAERELVETGMTDQEETDGVKIFSVSQEEKVLLIVFKKIPFLPFDNGC